MLLNKKYVKKCAGTFYTHNHLLFVQVNICKKSTFYMQYDAIVVGSWLFSCCLNPCIHALLFYVPQQVKVLARLCMLCYKVINK